MSRSQTYPAGRLPGRNDPCPCGSGRKYKQCCALRPEIAAPVRAPLGPLTESGRIVAGSLGYPPIAEPAPLATARPGPPAAASPGPSPAVARVLREATRLVDTGHAEAALPLLHDAARAAPADPLIWLGLGTALLRCDRVDEAVSTLAHAVWLDDTLAKAHYQLGLAWSRKGAVTEAIAAFRAAATRAPKFAEAHLRLGELLQSRARAGEAAEAFDRAATAGGGTTIGRLAAAQALAMRNRREDAVTLLRRASAIDGKSIDLIRLLATTLAECGRLAEAEEQFRQALALDPKNVVDCYQLAVLRKATAADRPFLERMTGLLQAGDITGHERMLLHFGLGKAHDELREFEAAARHFDAANRIRAATAPLDRAALTRFVDRQIALFPSDATCSAGEFGVDDARPVLIVGLPRSGTTLVEQILSSHPSVAAGGELGFWGEHGAPAVAADAGAFTRESLHALAAGYQAVLRGVSADASRVIDKNPFNYLYAGLAHLVFPRASIIHCRRHPVDTCLSMYATYFVARDTLFMGNREDLVFYHGEYSRLMRHWREVLPPARFLEIDYEALTDDPESETRRLVAFCGLEWHEACLHPERNRRAVATASFRQARQPVYRGSVARWRNYLPWLGPLAELLTDAERAG